MIRGPDVSSVQGVVPWDQVAAIAGVRFGIAKCTQGNDGKDPTFDRNIAAIRAAGLAPGAYHFGYPLPHLDPAAQAKAFFDVCGGLGSKPGELPPLFDLEWPAPQDFAKWHCTDVQIVAWAIAFLVAAEKLWGVPPGVYTYPYFEASLHVPNGSDLGRYPLHLAEYTYTGKLPPEQWRPKAPAPWSRATLCQHDGNGGLRLPNGVDCDWNVFLGTEDEWAAFLRLPVAACETAPA